MKKIAMILGVMFGLFILVEAFSNVAYAGGIGGVLILIILIAAPIFIVVNHKVNKKAKNPNRKRKSVWEIIGIAAFAFVLFSIFCGTIGGGQWGIALLLLLAVGGGVTWQIVENSRKNAQEEAKK